MKMKKNKNLMLIVGAGLVAYFLLKKKTSPETPENTTQSPTQSTQSTQLVKKAFINKPQFASLKKFGNKRMQVDGFIH
jgi:hypothetical protein